MGHDYPPLRRKKQKMKDAQGWVVSKYSMIPAAVFFAIGAISLLFWSEVQYYVALVCGVMGLPLLIAALNCRVTMDSDSLTVRNFFRISKTYDFTEVESYRENRHYTYLYLTNGKRLRLRAEDEVDERFSHLFRRLKQSRAVQKEGVSHSRLYWGNCSRPVQLTLFLSVLSIVCLVAVGFVAVGISYLTLDEARLEQVSFTVAHVEQDEFIFLYDENGERYSVYADLAEGMAWRTLEDERVTVYIDDTAEICGLTDAQGRAWFTVKQYREDEFGANLALTLIAGAVFLLFGTWIVLAFVAYRDPEAHLRLYTQFETMNFWSRHG